jgi:hypothetical protein
MTGRRILERLQDKHWDKFSSVFLVPLVANRMMPGGVKAPYRNKNFLQCLKKILAAKSTKGTKRIIGLITFVLSVSIVPFVVIPSPPGIGFRR